MGSKTNMSWDLSSNKIRRVQPCPTFLPIQKIHKALPHITNLTQIRVVGMRTEAFVLNTDDSDEERLQSEPPNVNHAAFPTQA
jgi:hypothetical protein